MNFAISQNTQGPFLPIVPFLPNLNTSADNTIQQLKAEISMLDKGMQANNFEKLYSQVIETESDINSQFTLLKEHTENLLTDNIPSDILQEGLSILKKDAEITNRFYTVYSKFIQDKLSLLSQKVKNFKENALKTVKNTEDLKIKTELLEERINLMNEDKIGYEVIKENYLKSIEKLKHDTQLINEEVEKTKNEYLSVKQANANFASESFKNDETIFVLMGKKNELEETLKNKIKEKEELNNQLQYLKGTLQQIKNEKSNEKQLANKQTSSNTNVNLDNIFEIMADSSQSLEETKNFYNSLLQKVKEQKDEKLSYIEMYSSLNNIIANYIKTAVNKNFSIQSKDENNRQRVQSLLFKAKSINPYLRVNQSFTDIQEELTSLLTQLENNFNSLPIQHKQMQEKNNEITNEISAMLDKLYNYNIKKKAFKALKVNVKNKERIPNSTKKNNKHSENNPLNYSIAKSCSEKDVNFFSVKKGLSTAPDKSATYSDDDFDVRDKKKVEKNSTQKTIIEKNKRKINKNKKKKKGSSRSSSSSSDDNRLFETVETSVIEEVSSSQEQSKSVMNDKKSYTRNNYNYSNYSGNKSEIKLDFDLINNVGKMLDNQTYELQKKIKTKF